MSHSAEDQLRAYLADRAAEVPDGAAARLAGADYHPRTRSRSLPAAVGVLALALAAGTAVAGGLIGHGGGQPGAIAPHQATSPDAFRNVGYIAVGSGRQGAFGLQAHGDNLAQRSLNGGDDCGEKTAPDGGPLLYLGAAVLTALPTDAVRVPTKDGSRVYYDRGAHGLTAGTDHLTKIRKVGHRCTLVSTTYRGRKSYAVVPDDTADAMTVYKWIPAYGGTWATMVILEHAGRNRLAELSREVTYLPPSTALPGPPGRTPATGG